MKMRRIISKIRSDAGMTMIEVTIAGVVLMGAVITMMAMFDTALGILRFTTSRSLATQIGNEALEDMRSLDFAQAVIYDSGSWPDDPDLDTASDPPKYKDIDDEGNPAWRPLLTTDTAAGLMVEQSRERQHVNFVTRRYVFFVDDGVGDTFKRLIVKVAWTSGNQHGELVFSTNFALQDGGESRPLGKILGVRSTNFNYFSATSEDTTMGLDDTIRGPKTGVSAPVVWTEAAVSGVKASYIDRVEYKLYNPAGTTVVRETTVESDSVSAIGGRYFLWPLNTTDPLLADAAGYKIRAESFDDLGRSDVDGMRINIDNVSPPPPNASLADGTGERTVEVMWTWSDPGGVVPERTRFVIRRKMASSDIHNYAAIAAADATGTGWSFMDAGLVQNDFPYYTVTAVDSAGNVGVFDVGGKSKSRAAVDVVAPSSVTTATGAAASWKAVTLSWSQASDTGSGVAGYHWQGTDDGGSNWTRIAVPRDITSDPAFFVDQNLKPGKNYQYRVKAFDVEGNLSATYYTLPSVSTPMR